VPPEGLTPSEYFEAGLTLLAEKGPDGLTIAALCAQLEVTKGSFYHHFRDLAAFVDGLLAHWAEQHATRLIALSESMTDPAERIDLLRAIAVGLPHGAEAAIRAWSWSNDRVAAVQREVDASRLAHLTAAGIDTGLSDERAELMATISMATLIGMQQLERPPRPETMEAIFGAFENWILEPDGAPVNAARA
jgi:AcrR family transcriptional regulator